MNINNIKKAIKTQTTKGRSYWARGVAKYALELLASAEERGYTDLSLNPNLTNILLNGAQNWKQYSEGGCSLISDNDIATRLCSPAEITKYYHGNPCGKRPNRSEDTWIDTQSRALFQAARLIVDTIDELENPTRVIDRTDAA